MAGARVWGARGSQGIGLGEVRAHQRPSGQATKSDRGQKVGLRCDRGTDHCRPQHQRWAGWFRVSGGRRGTLALQPDQFAAHRGRAERERTSQSLCSFRGQSKATGFADEANPVSEQEGHQPT